MYEPYLAVPHPEAVVAFLRLVMRQAEIEADVFLPYTVSGKQVGVSTEVTDRLKALERDIRELHKAMRYYVKLRHILPRPSGRSSRSAVICRHSD